MQVNLLVLQAAEMSSYVCMKISADTVTVLPAIGTLHNV
jgi:hypothetical protein